MRKQLNLSIRINEELFEKIDHMARKTGVSRSELARVILSDSSAIQIINGSQIATELFKIRQLLEKDGLDEVIRQEIFQSCKCELPAKLSLECIKCQFKGVKEILSER